MSVERFVIIWQMVVVMRKDRKLLLGVMVHEVLVLLDNIVAGFDLSFFSINPDRTFLNWPHHQQVDVIV